MIELIPAIDLIEGKCVRLEKGDFNYKTIYRDDPVDLARKFEDLGFRRLHIVDLEGAGKGRLTHLRVMENIAARTALVIDFGGGVQDLADVRSIFSAGASLVCIGSMAVKKEDEFNRVLAEYNGSKILLAADARDEKIVISGWKEDAGIPLLEFIGNMIKKGISSVLCTDIDRDGMLSGTSVKLYEKIMEKYPDLYLIASGGVGSAGDIQMLNEAGIPAVVFGKAWYEGKVKYDDLKNFI